MADQDDKVLKQDDVKEENPAVDTVEQPFAEGPSEDEVAAFESALLVHSEAKETGKAALDAAEENGDFMMEIKTKEHTKEARKAMDDLGFLGDEIPNSLGEAEDVETPEPANTDSTLDLDDVKDKARYGADLAIAGTNAAASVVTFIDPKVGAAVVAKSASWAAETEKASSVPFAKPVLNAVSSGAEAYARTVADAENRLVDSVSDPDKNKKAA